MSGFLINIKTYIFGISLFTLTVILSLDFWFAILPTNKIIISLYLLVTFFVSLWITFKLVQRVLKNPEPRKQLVFASQLTQWLETTSANPTIEQDINDCIEDTSQTIKNIDEHKLKLFLDSINNLLKSNCKDYSLDNCLVTDSVTELENLLQKFFKILQFINFKDILHGILIIFLRHIKEFKRCVKRTHSLGGNIEDNFRLTHIGSQNGQLFETFILKLTSEVLSHFLNSELYNSLSGQCLAGAIAKKVTMARIVDLAKPGYINYFLINTFANEKSKNNVGLDGYGYISICDVDHTDNISLIKFTNNWKRTRPRSFVESDSIEGSVKINTNLKQKENISEQKNICEDVVDRKINNEPEQSEDQIDAVVDSPDRPTKSNNCHQSESSSFEEVTINNDKVTVRPIKVSEPVKIYQSKSNKTWRNSSDLECISLGQDLLELDNIDPDIQLNNFIDNSLWTDNDFAELDEKVDKSLEKPDELLTKLVVEDDLAFFGTACDKVFTSTHSIQQGAATLVTNTVKHLSTTTKELGEEISHATASTFSNMKELQQTTVNNVIKPVSQATTHAMHKIEDLQDEAAGMVEGLLDFGKAGLRKGLRLTGLDEIDQAITTTDQQTANRRKLIGLGLIKQSNTRMGSTGSNGSNSSTAVRNGKGGGKSDSVDSGSVWINPLTSKSPSFDGEILLEMSPTDSGIITATTGGIPEIPLLEINSIDSPDPIEYEDAPDLATTTAKLRSLLAQRTESTLSTPALSPMPIEERSSSLLPTPLDPSSGSFDDLSDVDGALPSMYKQWAKTATGVFQNTLNTIKTALPGNPDSNSGGGNIKASGDDVTDFLGCSDWIYVPNKEAKIHKRIQKIISERKEFCTIDKAYEAVEQSMDQKDDHKKSIQFEDDELDDFDLTIPISKVLLEIICELAGDYYPFIVKETFVRATLLTLGDTIERAICHYTDRVATYIRQTIEPVRGDVNTAKQMALVMTVNELVETIINDSLSDLLKTILGEDSIHRVIKLFVESMQSQRLNEDVALQIVELLAAKTIDAVRRSSQTQNRLSI